MSYDLVVFDPELAPKDYASFAGWVSQRTEWVEGATYDNPAVASPALQDWFARIAKSFPPMNGPGADPSPDADGTLMGDYSISHELIYASFAWSKVGDAYARSFAAAEPSAVGLFEISDNSGRVWLPSSGSLRKVFPASGTGLRGLIERILGRKPNS